MRESIVDVPSGSTLRAHRGHLGSRIGRGSDELDLRAISRDLKRECLDSLVIGRWVRRQASALYGLAGVCAKHGMMGGYHEPLGDLQLRDMASDGGVYHGGIWAPLGTKV